MLFSSACNRECMFLYYIDICYITRDILVQFCMDVTVGAFASSNVCMYILYKTQKSFPLKTSTCKDKQDGNNTTILLYHPYILCHFANYALCLLVVYTEGLSWAWKAAG